MAFTDKYLNITQRKEAEIYKLEGSQTWITNKVVCQSLPKQFIWAFSDLLTFLVKCVYIYATITTVLWLYKDCYHSDKKLMLKVNRTNSYHWCGRLK